MSNTRETVERLAKALAAKLTAQEIQQLRAQIADPRSASEFCGALLAGEFAAKVRNALSERDLGEFVFLLERQDRCEAIRVALDR